MKFEIKKYSVQHPFLKNYIKFFWEIHAEHMQLDHKIIPVRNIDLKFNLSETSHYECVNGKEHLLDEVYFSGLHDHYRDSHLKFNGKVDLVGVCFQPDGFFPFIKIPLSEFKNQILGAGEAGFKPAKTIIERLRENHGMNARLNILESELARMVDNEDLAPRNFGQLFNILKQSDNSFQIAEFCKRNNIGMRKLERLYNKYVGVSAKTYGTLNRFQNSLNQLFFKDYSKLSDIAYSNGYFDQMHFIKEFKRFAGNTPKSFVPQNDSMLHIGKPA